MAKKTTKSGSGGPTARIKQRDAATRGKIVDLADDLVKRSFANKEPTITIPTRTKSNTIWNRKKGILQMGDAASDRELFNLNQAKQFMQTMLHASTILARRPKPKIIVMSGTRAMRGSELKATMKGAEIRARRSLRPSTRPATKPVVTPTRKPQSVDCTVDQAICQIVSRTSPDAR